VGGVEFLTSRQTLTRVRESYFGARFSGNFDEETGFIDRDPTHFRYILNHLRDFGTDNGTELPSDEHALRQLLAEAKYYSLRALEDEIQARSTSPCVVLNVGGSEFVTSAAVAEKLPCECITSKGEPPLRGRMFIDRDPKHFRRILNYLRDKDSVQDNDCLPLPLDQEGLREYLLEARFFKQEHLAEQIEDRLDPDEGTSKDFLGDIADQLGEISSSANQLCNSVEALARSSTT
jgi:hypothetical protein